MTKNILYLLIVIFLSFISLFPLLHSGLPPTHDGEYHVVRFYEFDKVLREGIWYPRWAPDLNFGFGIPLFNYVYPLPNYIASFLHMFGVSFIDSFKLNMFIASIIGAIFFYLWTKEFWGKEGAVISSVFYTFSPYHFVDIYVRGSVGEVWALALYPGFLWALTKYLQKQDKLFYALSAIFFALIIFSHNILALMFVPLSVSYALFLIWKTKKSILLIVQPFFLGMGLSSIFWLPALFEKKYVVGLEIYNVLSNFPDLYQLLVPSWGSGFFNDAVFQNQMSVQIGIANLLAILLSFVVLLILKKRKDQLYFVVLFFLAWVVFLFFLITPYSLFIWKNIPFMNYFQFPWRFLSIMILSTSFLAGSTVHLWEPTVVAIVLILLTFALSIGYTSPAYYYMRDDNYYTSRRNFMDGTNSPGNVFNTVWAQGNLKRGNNKLADNSQVSLLSENISSADYNFVIESASDTKVTVNTLYFPGWKSYIDNKAVLVNNNDGFISLFLPKGRHKLRITFEDTLVRSISKLVSGVFLLFLCLFSLKRKLC